MVNLLYAIEAKNEIQFLRRLYRVVGRLTTKDIEHEAINEIITLAQKALK